MRSRLVSSNSAICNRSRRRSSSRHAIFFKYSSCCDFVLWKRLSVSCSCCLKLCLRARSQKATNENKCSNILSSSLFFCAASAALCCAAPPSRPAPGLAFNLCATHQHCTLIRCKLHEQIAASLLNNAFVVPAEHVRRCNGGSFGGDGQRRQGTHCFCDSNMETST